jgi:nitroimidazol reductase NimA-like FMN-containing flavoprotein (pyridoxamine 5'-phosphate oxidase superfamily)
MSLIDARTWMEHLSTENCWDLLRSTPVGRVVVEVDGGPEVFPVNHVVDSRTIAFRTAPGTKLAGLRRMASTCFEADDLDPEHESGWSVLVKGRVHEVTDPEELRRLGTLPLALWTTGVKDHWVRIRPTEVTGRRIHTGEGATP